MLFLHSPDYPFSCFPKSTYFVALKEKNAVCVGAHIALLSVSHRPAERILCHVDMSVHLSRFPEVQILSIKCLPDSLILFIS